MAENWIKLLGGAGKRRRLASGETVYRLGDPADALYRLVRGRVRLRAGGQALHTAYPGELFGEGALFRDAHVDEAVAERMSVVEVLPRRPILLYLRAHPDLNLAFSAYLANQLEKTRARAELLRLKSARDRILTYLAQAGAASGPITLDRPLTTVAAEIGLTHEAFYRTLRVLETEGVIVREGKRSFKIEG
ncbi:MAG: Crp/Fnr family transcriptional regulator [Pseudomonadota bacterium]